MQFMSAWIDEKLIVHLTAIDITRNNGRVWYEFSIYMAGVDKITFSVSTRDSIVYDGDEDIKIQNLKDAHALILKKLNEKNTY